MSQMTSKSRMAPILATVCDIGQVLGQVTREVLGGNPLIWWAFVAGFATGLGRAPQKVPGFKAPMTSSRPVKPPKGSGVDLDLLDQCLQQRTFWPEEDEDF